MKSISYQKVSQANWKILFCQRPECGIQQVGSSDEGEVLLHPMHLSLDEELPWK